MVTLFRFGSWRSLLLSSLLLPLLLVQQGGWQHALSHVSQAFIAAHGVADRASHTSQHTPPADSKQDGCLACLAFSAGGHAAPLAAVAAWQPPQLPMAWASTVETGRAGQAFLPYWSRAPPL